MYDEELENSIPDCPLCGKLLDITFNEYNTKMERYKCPHCKKTLIEDSKNFRKFCVEMAVGYCASLEVEAESKEEAIAVAKQMVLDNPYDYFNDDNVEIEQINYVAEIT